MTQPPDRLAEFSEHRTHAEVETLLDYAHFIP